MTERHPTILPCNERWAETLAARIAAAGRAACARAGRFTIAISAAVLDANLGAALASPPIRDETFWRGTRLFLADSSVPADEAQLRALRTAAACLPLPPGAVHLAPAARQNAVAAANGYEQELRAIFSLSAGALPRFDLCVLALGPNGRIGGLLRGSRAVEEIGRLVVAEFVPSAGHSVVTLTAPVIQHAAAIVLIARAAVGEPSPLAPLGLARPCGANTTPI